MHNRISTVKGLSPHVVGFWSLQASVSHLVLLLMKGLGTILRLVNRKRMLEIRAQRMVVSQLSHTT